MKWKNFNVNASRRIVTNNRLPLSLISSQSIAFRSSCRKLVIHHTTWLSSSKLLPKLKLAGTKTGNDATLSASAQKTTLAQWLPDDMEEKVMQFHRFVIAARQRVGYPLSRIFNMDETPMWFQLPSLRSLEFTVSRTVAVKTCGAEKRNFTVALAVAADGTKLPPKVIFKGVRTPRDLVIPNSLRVSFHKKG